MMGLSQREGIAFQGLLDAVMKSLKSPQFNGFGVSNKEYTPSELAEHMLDFDQDVDDAAQALIAAIITDHRDMTPGPELSPKPWLSGSVPPGRV